MAVFTVNTTSDASDTTPPDDGIIDVDPNIDGDQISLRAAIEAANQNSDTDTIEFNIPGSGVQTISPDSGLPHIIWPVEIRGYTQPGSHRNTLPDGNNAVLLIELSGANAGIDANGLAFDPANSVSILEGLVINRFDAAGVQLLLTSNVTVIGNFIGSDSSGSQPVGNGIGIGILGSSFNIIGGAEPEARNLITASRGAGIEVHDFRNDSFVFSRSNSIHGNSIHSNGGLGIDLFGQDGVDQNDELDIDFGGHGLQNFPTLTAASRGATTRVMGTLESTPNASFILDFYANDVADPTGHGEGKRYLGSFPIVADETGHLDFDVGGLGATLGFEFITATATGSEGTSEFSLALAPPPSISIENVSANEADGVLTFTVELSQHPTQPLTLKYSTGDGAAVSPDDFASKFDQLITFDPRQTSKQISIALVKDAIDEFDEEFFLDLADFDGKPITSAVGTILDDNNPPTLTVADVQVLEGNGDSEVNAATFTLALSASSGKHIQVAVSTTPGTATEGVDYSGTPEPFIVNFAPGITRMTFVVPIVGEKDFEADETFFVNLEALEGADFAPFQAKGTILNDDTVVQSPEFTISDVSIIEGDEGQKDAVFTVTLLNPREVPVTVDYITTAGTATANVDYVSKTGQLTFGPNETSKTIRIPIIGDRMHEPDETFTVKLLTSNDPLGITKTSTGQTLLDNFVIRPLPQGVTISNPEYKGGTTSAGVYSNGDSIPLQIFPSGILLTTGDADISNSNTQGDFTGSVDQPAGDAFLDGLLTEGTTTDVAVLTFTIHVAQGSGIRSGRFDFQFGSEEFSEFVGTSFNDVLGAFINGGAETNVIRDSRGERVSVNSAFFDIDNEDGSTLHVQYDGMTSGLTATFPLHEEDNTFKVAIGDVGDSSLDSGVFLTDLRFSTDDVGPGGVTRLPTGLGVIVDNDPLPTVSVDNINVTEPATGDVIATFTVKLSNPSSEEVRVTYRTVDGTAGSSGDFDAQEGTITFLPGETLKTIQIRVHADSEVELDETFTIELTVHGVSAPSGQLAVTSDAIGDAAAVTVTATGTIKDFTPTLFPRTQTVATPTPRVLEFFPLQVETTTTPAAAQPPQFPAPDVLFGGGSSLRSFEPNLFFPDGRTLPLWRVVADLPEQSRAILVALSESFSPAVDVAELSDVAPDLSKPGDLPYVPAALRVPRAPVQVAAFIGGWRSYMIAASGIVLAGSLAMLFVPERYRQQSMRWVSWLLPRSRTRGKANRLSKKPQKA